MFSQAGVKSLSVETTTSPFDNAQIIKEIVLK